MTSQMKSYPAEFKQEAVALALRSPSIVETAKGLGIPAATLNTWIRKLRGSERKMGSPSNLGGATQESVNVATLLEENRRLHKKVLILKEEKEILKKAATYFTQHQK